MKALVLSLGVAVGLLVSGGVASAQSHRGHGGHGHGHHGHGNGHGQHGHHRGHYDYHPGHFDYHRGHHHRHHGSSWYGNRPYSPIPFGGYRPYTPGWSLGFGFRR